MLRSILQENIFVFGIFYIILNVVMIFSSISWYSVIFFGSAAIVLLLERTRPGHLVLLEFFGQVYFLFLIFVLFFGPYDDFINLFVNVEQIIIAILATIVGIIRFYKGVRKDE